MQFKKLTNPGFKTTYYLSDQGDVFNENGFIGYLHNGAYCCMLWGKNYRIDKLVNMYFNSDRRKYAIHLNGERTDNDFNNLTGSTDLGSLLRYYNAIKRANTGKTPGVYKWNHSKFNCYRAVLKVNNKVKTLGYFKTKAEAEEKVREAYKKYYGMTL
jgi:hypothetical protein